MLRVDGALPEGVTAKDIILAIIGEIGTAGGTGHVIEYAGDAISALSMEGRMTICNMSIEGGARAGLIAPDQKTFDYIKGRPRAPKGGAFEVAQQHWEKLYSDEDAHFDRIVALKANELPPIVSWGTSPEQVVSVDRPRSRSGRDRRRDQTQGGGAALDYMGLNRRREDHRYDTRPRVHRLLHQWQDRGSARGSQGRRGQAGQCRMCAP